MTETHRPLTISRVHTVEYRMPFARAFGTGKGVLRSSTSFLVRIHAAANGTDLGGVGESQPRKQSGDVDADVAWDFLRTAAGTVPNLTIDCASPQSSIESVGAAMDSLRGLAGIHAPEDGTAKPFRGTLVGIEAALLDLAGQALGLPLADLFGPQRDQIAVNARSLSSNNTLPQVRRKVEEQAAQYELFQVQGQGNIRKDLMLLQTVHQAITTAGAPKPVWIDLHGTLSRGNATAFVEQVAAAMTEDLLPRRLIIEQPVTREFDDHLPHLQKLADELTADRGGGLHIMADESVWDADDVERLHAEGGCGAINIKVAKAGGLLRSLELARRAVELQPDTFIAVTGMVGTSDVSTWSLLHLAKALPRLDAFTVVPPGNLAARITEPLTELIGDTNVHAGNDRAGVGAQLRYERVAAYTDRHGWHPEPAPPEPAQPHAQFPEPVQRSMQTPNNVDDPETVGIREQVEAGRNLGPVLLSRAAERDGATVEWVDDRVLFATVDDHSMLLLGHHGDESPVGATIIQNKYLSKQLLNEHGVRTPQAYRADSADHAVEHLHAIGGPVVIKPVSGSKGRGVTVGAANPNEVRAAYDRATAFTTNIMVEEFVEGTEYRCMANADECLSALIRVPPSVVGDGQLTIWELAEQKNATRKQNPNLINKLIRIDSATEDFLALSGLSLYSVPPKGQLVPISNLGNTSRGADVVQCLDDMDDEFKELSRKAVAAIPGLRWGGVDLMVSRDSGQPYVLEINSDSGLGGHHFPSFGVPKDVAGYLWHRHRQHVQTRPSTEPSQLAAVPEARPLAEVMEFPWDGNGRFGFSGMVKYMLDQRGYETEQLSHAQLRAVGPNGEVHWLRRSLGTKDLSAVHGVLRRHGLVLRLLRQAGIHHSIATKVRARKDVKSFLDRHGAPIVLTPFRREVWGGPASHLISSSSELPEGYLKNHRVSVAQAYREGHRLRVGAAPAGPILVLARTVDASRLDDSLLAEAYDVVTRAIRAVPGLRIGFVDVLIRPPLADEESDRTILVEGVSPYPAFDSTDIILAGSFDAVVDHLLESSCVDG